MRYDYVVVGAGIAGITFAENISRRLNKKVIIIEKRNHIGGNCYDEYNEDGILIHKYGPHIFHTNNKRVWDYLSQFTEWNSYCHKVLGSIDGKFVPIPFNLNTLHELLPESLVNKLENQLIQEFGYGCKIPILKLKQSSDRDLKFLADFIYEKVFLNYTTKQWGMKPEELDPEATGRVPVYISRDNRYFQDKYQGLPKYGYTKMFEKMLNDKNIHIMLNTDYKEIISEIKYDRIIYTGSIDYFSDYKYGKLPYRSLDFKFETYKVDQHQPVGVVNYPNDYDYTRITEFKHMTFQKHEFTTIVKEYPKDYKFDDDIPYYPIPQEGNMEIYNKYKNEIKDQKNVIFVGRLAEYRYYNMDAVVENILSFFER